MSHLRYVYNLISIRYIYLFEFDSSLGFTQNTHHMPNMLWKITNTNAKFESRIRHCNSAFFLFEGIPCNTLNTHLLRRRIFELHKWNIFYKKLQLQLQHIKSEYVYVCSVAPGKISSWISSRISYIEWRNENRANKVYSDSISFCWYLSVCRF